MRTLHFLVSLLGSLENRVHIAANPLNKEREHWLQSRSGTNPNEFSGQTSEIEEATQDNLLQKNKSKSSLEDCFTEEKGLLKCNFCPGTYKKRGHLKTHLEVKHSIEVDMICECGKEFKDITRMNRHMRTCKS